MTLENENESHQGSLQTVLLKVLCIIIITNTVPIIPTITILSEKQNYHEKLKRCVSRCFL